MKTRIVFLACAIISSCTSNPSINKVFSTSGSALGLNAVSFTSESKGYLVTSDEKEMTIWETIDAGATWQKVFEWYGMKYYDPRYLHAIYPIGSRVFGMAAPMGGFPSSFVYDENTRQLMDLEIPLNETPQVQWASFDSHHYYLSGDGGSYEVIVDTLGQMERRPANRTISKLLQMEGTKGCEYWIRYDKDSLYYKDTGPISTIYIHNPEEMAVSGNKVIIASLMEDGRRTINAIDIVDKTVKEIFEVEGYQFLENVLMSSDSIVLIVSNTAGIWGTSADIIYSLDGGRKWRRRVIGAQIDCSCLVGSNFYFGSFLGGLYKVQLDQ